MFVSSDKKIIILFPPKTASTMYGNNLSSFSK
jgi:hypothetical protein